MSSRTSEIKNNHHLTLALIQAMIVLSIWLISIDLIQFLTTEFWYLTNTISAHLSSTLLIIISVVVVVIIKDASQRIKMWTVIIFSIAFLAHIFYFSYYSSLQQWPKLKNVSKNWTIQGDKIIITGRNFGEAYQPGQIRVGDLEFLISSWTNYKIVAEQPMPSRFVTDTLKLCNFLDNCISIGQFTVTDPSTLQ